MSWFTIQCRHDVRDFLSNFFLVIIGCTCLFFVAEESFVVSSDAVSNFAILWVASLASGYLCDAVGCPPLLGSLVSGIILKNGHVNHFDLSQEFGDTVRTIGLCTILLISSMEIDIGAVAKAGSVSLRLTFLPGVTEAFTCAMASVWMFDMPWTFAFSLGFILAAVSPAIVVPGMFGLQKNGYGTKKGIPSIVMAAASFDDIVAITGFTICIGLAMDASDSNNLVLSAFVHGPVALFLGILTGGIGGVALAATRFCPDRWQRTIITLELALLMTYGYKRIHLDGCGAVGTLLMGTSARILWKQERVTEYMQCHGTEFLDEIGHNINILWDIVVRPLLFGSIGAALDLSVLPKENIFRSCAIIIIGLCVRVPIAFLSAGGRDLTVKERLFVALSWVPKATVQAALCALPLSMIQKKFTGSIYLDELTAVGNQIMSISILAIIITAPVGLLAIQFLGPHLLEKNDEQTKHIGAKQIENNPSLEEDKSVSIL